MEGLLGGGSGGGVAERSSDYYSALGCDPSSSDEQILAEYRKIHQLCLYPLRVKLLSQGNVPKSIYRLQISSHALASLTA